MTSLLLLGLHQEIQFSLLVVGILLQVPNFLLSKSFPCKDSSLSLIKFKFNNNRSLAKPWLSIVKSRKKKKKEEGYNGLGLPSWFSGKESACSTGDTASSPGSGRSPGGGNGNPLQSSCLGILWTMESGGLQSMDRKRIGHDLAIKEQKHKGMRGTSMRIWF